MPLYIVPANGEATAISEQTARAKIPFFQPANVRELIIATQAETIAVAALSEEIMLVLTRHASQLFVELPSVITSVPGLLYDQQWMAMGTIFPPTHWKTFEEQTKRSGVLATSLEDVGKRNVGANVGSSVRHDALSENPDEESDQAEY